MSIATLLLAVAMTPAGGWNVRVEADGQSGTFAIEPPPLAEVKGELHKRLPPPSNRPVWGKECQFKAVIAQCCTVGWSVDMASVSIRAMPDGPLLERGRDYEVDPQWGGIEWKEGASVGTNVPITVDYAYLTRRIDSVVAGADGSLRLKKGESHVVTPSAPALARTRSAAHRRRPAAGTANRSRPAGRNSYTDEQLGTLCRLRIPHFGRNHPR